MSTRVLVINGPNLGILGRRQPELYGTTTEAALRGLLTEHAGRLGLDVRFAQSNHEGVLIDLLEEEAGQARGCVINPGGLAHTSVALLDAMLAFPGPVIEVHLTNVAAREAFRARALTARGAEALIAGLGPHGYVLALEAVRQLIDTRQETTA